MDETYTPVVKAKPERGREIKSAKMPAEKMIESLKNVVEKPDQPTEGKEEIYHEGYVDGQKYLVPDSNLEAMKDMINIKMRPRRSLRYKHQTSFEISDYAHFNDKIKSLLEKVGTFSHSSSESTQEPSFAKYRSPEANESGVETQIDSEEDEGSKESETDSNESKTTTEFPESSIPESKPSIADYNERNVLEESLISSESKGSVADSKRSEKSNKSSTTSESNESASDSDKYMTPKESFATEESKQSPSVSSKSKESEESSILASISPPSSYVEDVDTEENLTTLIPEKEDNEKQESKQLHEINLKQEEEYQKHLDSSGEQEDINKKNELLSLTDEERGPVETPDPLALSGTNKTSQLYQTPSELLRQPELSRMKPHFYEPYQSENCHFRFLLSGHLRADDTPMFIIEEHNRKTSILKKQKADLLKFKQSVDADLAISGKFYKNNILEELNDEPIAYDILPQKIKIDQTKSKVFINSFLYNFYCGKTELTIKGEFINHNIKGVLTPKLSFKLEPRVPEYTEHYYPLGSDSPTTVLIYKPKYVNPFSYTNAKDFNKSDNKGPTADNILAPTLKSKDKKLDSNDCTNNEQEYYSIDRILSDSKLDTLKEQYTLNKEMENNLNKSLIHSEKSQKENITTKKIYPENPPNEHLEDVKKMIMKIFYSKKKLDKYSNEIIPTSNESSNSRQSTIQGPELKTYYQADDKGEYFSTYLPE